MKLLNRMAVLKGAAVAVVVCLPLALISNIVRDHDRESPLLAVLFVGVAAGFALAGWVAGRSEGDAPFSNGAFAALTGFVVIQGVAVIVRVAGGHTPRFGLIVGSALIAFAAGILGGWMAQR